MALPVDQNRDVCVLVPTCNRAHALAVTLTALAFQDDCDRFRIVISDQSDTPLQEDTLKAALRLLESRGVPVEILRNFPRQGMAQQRQFLLDRSRERFSLYIDDDVILEPWVIGMLRRVLLEKQCGFAGNALIGLSYRDDIRPDQQDIEFIEGRVKPERVHPGSPQWQRHRLHNAANLLHVQQRRDATPADPQLYKVAWVGGCVMYDTARLRVVGGFRFWRELPAAHCGEDVLAQLRVADRFGGCGVMPSGAYHQELETTVHDRRINAPEHLDIWNTENERA